MTFRFITITPDLLLAHAVSVDRALDLVGASCLEGGLLPSEFVATFAPEAVQRPKWMGVWALHPNEDLVIGSGMFKSEPRDGAVEIGYGVSPLIEGHGAATAICGELVNIAFQQGAQEIFAHTLPGAIASQKVLLKNRFIKTGEVVDPQDGLIWRHVRTIS